MLKEFQKKEQRTLTLPLILTTIYIVVMTVILKTYVDMVSEPKKIKIYQFNHSRFYITVFAFILFLVCAIALLGPIHSLAETAFKKKDGYWISKNGKKNYLTRNWDLKCGENGFYLAVDEKEYPISEEFAFSLSKKDWKKEKPVIMLDDSKQLTVLEPDQS